MSKTYLAKLTPLEYYFFGREDAFDTKGKAKNYFVKSNPLPQQTALLGMMRNLLREANYDFGKESFNGGIDQSFGAIEYLSPVFLTKDENNFFIKMAYDSNFLLEPKVGLLEANFITSENQGFVLQNYNPKHDFIDKWSNGSEELSAEDIFIEDTHIGINKKDTGQPENEAYYKQQYFRLGKNFSFAFIVKLKDEVEINKLNNAANLGAEGKMFSLLLSEYKGLSFEDLATSIIGPTKEDRLIFLSDTMAKEDIYASVKGAVIKTKPFRNIISPLTGNFSDLSRKGKDPSRLYLNTENLTLVARGSVVYVDNKETLKGELQKSPYYSIGYNHII